MDSLFGVAIGHGARLSLLVVVISLVAAASCSSEPSPQTAPDVKATSAESTSTPTDSPRTSTPSTSDVAELEATAAYLGMWADFAAAAETSDWQSPELARHAADEALSVLSRGLYADRYNGLVSKGEPELDPAVSSMDPPDDPSTVVIADCGDSSNWLRYDAETGELADDQPGGRRVITAIVEKQPDGVWKVTGFAVEAVGTC